MTSSDSLFTRALLYPQPGLCSPPYPLPLAGKGGERGRPPRMGEEDSGQFVEARSDPSTRPASKACEPPLPNPPPRWGQEVAASLVGVAADRGVSKHRIE